MKAILYGLIIFTVLINPINCDGQAPNFRAAHGFALFTSQGAVTNTAVTTIAGNVGTNFGAISGFEPPSIINGNFYTEDDTTKQAALDLLTAYDELINAPVTVADHAPAFGTEVVTPGVYATGGAGSINGHLTLNAEGNADAVFIFRFGGAFTVGAGSVVTLSNGALAGKVYWVGEGAISMAANINIKGTIIAHNGANSLGTNSVLEGRMFSTQGAVNVYNNVITKISGGGYTPVPIELLSFTGGCDNNQNTLLNWRTATETNNKYFSIERSDNAVNWELITQVNGAINSSVEHTYNYTYKLLKKGNYFYRLKQTDLDGSFKYGHIIYIKNCGAAIADNVSVYADPNNGKIKLFYNGDKSLVKLIQVFNANGAKCFEVKSFLDVIDLSDKQTGLYYIRLNIDATIITKEIIVRKP